MITRIPTAPRAVADAAAFLTKAARGGRAPKKSPRFSIQAKADSLRGPRAAAPISVRYNSTRSASGSAGKTESGDTRGGGTRPARPCPKCGRSIPLPLSPCPECSTLLPLPSDLSLHSLLYISAPVASAPASSSSFQSPTKAKAPGAHDILHELSLLPSNGFKLDKSDLRSKWVRRQRELHPDKYSSRGDAKIALARELSGRVNEAYNVLGDELKRAEYLLSLHDQGPEETDKITDPALLMEIMEAREELEEASSAEDIARVRETNQSKVEETIAALHNAFAQTPPDLEAAKDLAVQLRYWRGLEAAAKEKVF